MNVTRQVILDLWPIYAAGEASADTRALVEAFLAEDPAFATAVRDSAGSVLGTAPPPVLTPDHELQTLSRTRRRLKGYDWLLQFAMLFTFMAFGRIIADTSWDVSPRNFIAVASLAMAFWIAFCVKLIRMRKRILIVPPLRSSK